VNGADAAGLTGVDIPLVRGDACALFGQRREWFVADSDIPPACTPATPAPLLVVAIGGGGTQLLDRNEGVSVGLIDIVNGVRAQAAAAGVSTGVILMTSAIESADLPQTRMEQWLAADLRRRIDATPCLRVVLIGHSHGAVLATSVMAALEDRYGDRMYGVLLDRSLLYYDRQAMELPQRAPLLNIFQLNEGWHGEPINSPNAINLDASAEVAPREPRDGPLPMVAVAHSTLDDSTGVQREIADLVGYWLRGARP
jgi:pimeloyl-ACP methyl ester carboxylesterase